MRSHGKNKRPLNPQDLFCELANLICDKRRCGLVDKNSQHNCLSTSNSHTNACCNVQDEATNLWKKELPFCLQVFLIPLDCHCTQLPCGGEVLLERWIIETLPRRNQAGKPIIGELLLQAVRSHLCFSQLTAWMSLTDQKLTFRLGHRLCLPGDLEEEASGHMQSHNFPVCSIDKSKMLSVKVLSGPRTDQPPNVICSPNISPTRAPNEQDTSTEVNMVASSCKEVVDAENNTISQSSSSPTNMSDLSRNSSLTDNECTAYPSPPPSTSNWTNHCRENPLFNIDSCLDIASRMQSLSLNPSQTHAVRSRPVSPVRFYFSDKEEMSSGLKSPGKWGRKRERIESGEKLSSHRLSRKILYSTDEDISFVSPESSESNRSFTEAWKIVPQEEDVRAKEPRSRWDVHRKTSFTEGSDNSHRRKGATIRDRPMIRANKPVEAPSLTSRFLRRSVPSGDLGFSRNTGLPLNSSPAPLKRNQHSFDFDSSLNSVAQIRSALYTDHDSGSSDSECGTSLCKSAPASTNLLGNFEESALNGRIKPFGSVQGFILDLAASGAFCPPHVTLPVTTFFFQVSEDNAPSPYLVISQFLLSYPSPYLGHCSLEPLGKKGYHLPKKGTVQATLFNPQQTVVKMFVVRYDLADMPPLCQTFVRQRTYLMPANASRQDARQNTSWLRYLIHLRLSSSRSGKLYLHSDVRMLFSRKSALDANCSDVSIADDLLPSSLNPPTSATSESYELRSFTEMPHNPKFSPRKVGRLSARGSEEQIE